MTPTSVPPPTLGVPAIGLPNLDGLRNVQPEEPEVPDAVPSTRCSPGQPDCDPTTGNPEPPTQASHWARGRHARLRRTNPTRRAGALPQDHLLAWIDTSFSNPLPKYGALREATDTSVRNDAFFSLFPQPEDGSYDDFVMARLDPDNRIGIGGEDILSRNFNWSLPLVGMAGRAGLNLGLSLSYNSLVWTRSGNYITFDADNGFPTPGFRLGFPVIYGLHYNSQTETYGYLMLMPSGNRVELRQVDSSDVYEAADSSYLQLTDNRDGTLLVRSTDGAQLSYISTANGFRCSEVKDRNGNYLSITNSEKGRLESVTDTLGRVFNFYYDENNNLSTIKQTRGASEYTWVTFYYTDLTLQTNFTGLTIVGLPNGSTLPVLSKVVLPDGTYYKFSYNTWGQVYKITNYAADSNPSNDNHPLNYVLYNLPLTSSTAQTDCPRFTQRKDWAENWMSGADVVTNFAVPTSATWTMPGGSQQSGTFSQIQTPDGVYQNVYSRSSGWDEGMPVLVNTYDSQVVLQRQATTSYTQDNTGVGYMLNPRVTESNVYDPSGNHKRTAISYSTSFGLPTDVKEYAANATTVLRTTQTDYNLGSDYTDRRIIGLPSQKRVCEAANCNAPVSRVDFLYDESGEFLVQQGSPIQHDSDNYGTGFTYRGNLTRVKRWNVASTSESVESKTGYNTTGMPIFTRSPQQTSDTQANVIYTDSFSDGQNRNTFAYATEVTIKDTVGDSSALVTISNKSQYSFDTGSVTRAEGPPPAGQSQGAIVTNEYDSVDRLYQTTNAVSGATVHIVYPTSSNVIQTYTTILNTQSTTVAAKLFDGAGNVRAVAEEHPGSTGGYVGQYFVYDVMGRQIQQTNPTEIYGSWIPAGDDVAGWNWTVQTYDWKGRPRVSTNQDGTTKEATYGGCGCAGGEIVTLRDEGTIINGVLTKRQQKLYSDVLGRVWKAEDYNWSGGSLYRTTTNSYNALDKVINVISQDASSGASQTTSMTYDGYGRVASRHVPIQSSGTNSNFIYNNDGSLHTMTDARGVTATYSYNNRNLLTGVNYTVPTNPAPNPAVASTLPSTFRYDKAGNRTEVIDGVGNTTYQYNQLSRLTSETRHFNDITSRDFTFAYSYNVSGGLTSMTEPFGAVTNYSYDSAGRLSSVSGSGLGVSNYISQIEYRAWGSPKRILYGNSFDLKLNYNPRLAVSRFEGLKGMAVKIGADYQYDIDGSLRFTDDMMDPKLDRSYKYDHVGRISEAKSGAEARGEPATDDRPYNQSYLYDTWDNTTERAGRHWTQDVSFGGVYLNNRNVMYQYDADGRYLGHDYNGGVTEIGYNAAGQQTVEAETTFTEEGSTAKVTTRRFDGDGQMVSEDPMTYCNTCPPPTSNASYYVRSSVLGGQPVAVVNQQAETKWRYVYANGELIASSGNGYVSSTGFEWRHNAPSGSGVWKSYASFGTNGYIERTELDPVGADVGPENPYTGGGGPGGNPNSGDLTSRFANAADFGQCTTDGVLDYCGRWFRSKGVAGMPGRIGNGTHVRFRRGGEIRRVPASLLQLSNGTLVWWPQGASTDGDRAYLQFPDGAWGLGTMPPASTTVASMGPIGGQGSLIRESRVNEIVNAVRYIDPSLLKTIIDNKKDKESLVLSLCQAAQESTFLKIQEADGTVRGVEGAFQDDTDKIDLGLFQIQRGTANGLGLGTFSFEDIRDNDALNTTLATTYLQSMVDRYGSLRNGLGAYKQGQTITDKRKKKGQGALSGESKQYADEILECVRRFNRIGHFER